MRLPPGNSSPALQARLESLFADVDRKRVAVALTDAGRTQYAGVGDGAGCGPDPGQWVFATGCVTKLLTAELVRHSIARRGVSLDDRVSDLFARRGRGDALAGVTIRHLLEHTHAVVDPGRYEAPRLADGRVDVDRLLRSVRTSPLRRPGELYSYSDFGSWMASAVVERLTGGAFLDALASRLDVRAGARAPIAADGARTQRPAVCASRGATLALSVRELIGFADRARAGGAARFPPADRDDAITPLPGWHVVERGVHLGWKSYGEGWFGHNSVLPGASLLVRIQPARETSLVVASRDHQAALVAARLFAGWLPEFAGLAVPGSLPGERAARVDPAGYCGRYGARRRLVVERRDGALAMCSGGSRAVLTPAGDDLFFTCPVLPGRPAYLQFLRREEHGFCYAWDGQQLHDNADGRLAGRRP